MSVEWSELIWYVWENEELKLKVASLMKETKANAEEITNLRGKNCCTRGRMSSILSSSCAIEE